MIRVIAPYHAVTCANITDPEVEQLFRDGRRAHVMFGDPPWGEGNTKFWSTKAAKDTGREYQPVPYDSLIARWIDLAANYVTGHVFLETGRRWADDAERRLRDIGLLDIQRTELLYKGGGKLLPNVLLYGAVHPGEAIDIAPLHHMTGQAVSVKAVGMVAKPGQIVFDPCCGMGYSAQAAIENGMEFRGNELNPVRLQKTIARLERAAR